MLPFVSIKINGVMYAIGYREPEEYKIIRLFFEIQDVMVKHGHSEMDLIEIYVVLPWTTSRQRKLSSNNSELYWVFEFFLSIVVLSLSLRCTLGQVVSHFMKVL